MAVRQARERLDDDGWESDIPGVTWLPVICQNPVALSLTWPTKKKTSTLVFFGMAVCVAALLGLLAWQFIRTSPLPPVPSITKVSLYENKNYKISMEYPQNWEEKLINDPFTGNLVQLIAPKENSSDTFQEYIQLSVDPLESPNVSLDEYTDRAVKQIGKEFPDKISSLNKTTLASREAKKVVYTKKDREKSYKITKIWTLKNNIAYI
ncbi:MAG: hypothetical protein F6K35_28745 [Okeania sp. SIO2H7]|nr:hypothetical protein [Okeania sp. SIO2H7]